MEASSRSAQINQTSGSQRKASALLRSGLSGQINLPVSEAPSPPPREAIRSTQTVQANAPTTSHQFVAPASSARTAPPAPAVRPYMNTAPTQPPRTAPVGVATSRISPSTAPSTPPSPPQASSPHGVSHTVTQVVQQAVQREAAYIRAQLYREIRAEQHQEIRAELRAMQPVAIRPSSPEPRVAPPVDHVRKYSLVNARERAIIDPLLHSMVITRIRTRRTRARGGVSPYDAAEVDDSFTESASPQLADDHPFSSVPADEIDLHDTDEGEAPLPTQLFTAQASQGPSSYLYTSQELLDDSEEKVAVYREHAGS